LETEDTDYRIFTVSVSIRCRYCPCTHTRHGVY